MLTDEGTEAGSPYLVMLKAGAKKGIHSTKTYTHASEDETFIIDNHRSQSVRFIINIK